MQQSTLASQNDNYKFKMSNPNVKMASVPQLRSLGDQVPFYVGGSGQVQQAMRSLKIDPYSAKDMASAGKQK